MVDKTLEVEFHFQCAVPVLKCEHRPPVQPECGTEYLIVKHVFDGFVIEIFVFCHEQFHDLHTAFLAQIELPVGV